jgi:hypothetical protein
MRDRSGPGRRQPRSARGTPRPASRAPRPCCAGSTPWSSTAPAGTPPSPPAPPAARRRPPDQRCTACTRGGTLDLLPDEGTASPQTRRGPTSQETLGSRPLVARAFSPARLNAVGAGPPAPRGPSPLALRRARRPGPTSAATAPRNGCFPARNSRMPAPRLVLANTGRAVQA